MEALLIIDPQIDFCPGGGLAVPSGDKIIPVINRLADAHENVIVTQDWHPAGHESFASSHEGKNPFDVIALDYGEQILWPDHCVIGSRGAELHPDLEAERAQLVIRKGFRRQIDSYSAFFENDHRTPTGLGGYLNERGITSLVVAGLAFDFCVHWTAVDGRKLGFDVTVVTDASASIDADGSHDAAVQKMREAGVEFATSEALVEQHVHS